MGVKHELTEPSEGELRRLKRRLGDLTATGYELAALDGVRKSKRRVLRGAERRILRRFLRGVGNPPWPLEIAYDENAARAAALGIAGVEDVVVEDGKTGRIASIKTAEGWVEGHSCYTSTLAILTAIGHLGIGRLRQRLREAGVGEDEERVDEVGVLPEY